MKLNGQKIKKFMREKKMKHEHMACALGCSERTVRHMISGTVPRGELLLKLALVMSQPAELLVK